MKTLVVAAGIIRSGEDVLICQRPDEKPLEGGKWEFPGGKTEQGETPQAALKRELKEELDIEVEVGSLFDVRVKAYQELSVMVMFYFCRVTEGAPKALEHQKISFVPVKELPAYDLADTDRRAAQRLIFDKETTHA